MYFFYYFPIGVDVPRERFPVMTALFAGICIVAFLANKYFADALGFNVYAFVYYPGDSVPTAVLTSAFLHFGYVHLIGNLIYLLLFGAYLEDRLGPALYAVVYLGSAVVGNYAQAAYNAHVFNTTMGIIGASGAVSGLLGAFLVRFYRARVRVAYWVFAPLLAYTKAGRSYVPVVVAMGLWVLLQSVRSLLQFEGASVAVAHVTHLGGFLFGLLISIVTGGMGKGRLEAHLIKARACMRRGEFYGARDELEAYVDRSPDDASIRAALARLQIQCGDVSQAIDQYINACVMHLARGQRGEAEAIYQELTRSYPYAALPPTEHLDMAFGLERNLKLEVALKAYQSFADRYRTHPEAPFALLRAANLERGSFGRPDDARALYRKLIARYPTDAWADFAREQVRVLAG